MKFNLKVSKMRARFKLFAITFFYADTPLCIKGVYISDAYIQTFIFTKINFFVSKTESKYIFAAEIFFETHVETLCDS